ncbi:hypothetical protein [Aeromonas dhakensis]|uniref:hypothetical protein n=1 Tax=Aeromonas dhakensis TaxID=196024 RepID=UPI002B45C83D|nr:hypothetical protein [Aeromonas dhakensis]
MSQANETTQQTGGWNSGAVALSAHIMANTATVFPHNGNAREKYGSHANTFSVRGKKLISGFLMILLMIAIRAKQG